MRPPSLECACWVIVGCLMAGVSLGSLFLLSAGEVAFHAPIAAVNAVSASLCGVFAYRAQKGSR
jgi:putative flippase GtrA